jgi:pimeloyl-ACP methyl ester carboxylesterase
MKKLEIGDWQQRPYGERARGVARVGSHAIRFTVRRPDNQTDTGMQYVLVNGWTTGKNSMRQAAMEAARHGHTAYTFDYTNTHRRDALGHNATDLTTMIEAMPRHARIGLIGLSMGGAVATVAMNRVGHKVDEATLVASGRYLLPEFYSKRQIVRHLISHSAESVLHHGRFTDDMHLLGTSVINCAKRGPAVIGEFLELVDGDVHEELRSIKSQSNAPLVQFWYGSGDRLLPAEAQLASIQDLPFDQIIEYRGGHDLLARSPALAHSIFEQNVKQNAA